MEWFHLDLIQSGLSLMWTWEKIVYEKNIDYTIVEGFGRWLSRDFSFYIRGFLH